MAEPNESIAEKIVQNIVTTLSEIRRKDGYWFDITEDQVTRAFKTADEIAAAEMPFIKVIMGDGDAETVVMPRKDEEDLEIFIDLIVKNTDLSMLDKTRERAIRDVRKKLQVDTHRGSTSGIRHAMFTKIRTVSRFEGAAGYPDHSAARIGITVKYRFLWSAP